MWAAGMLERVEQPHGVGGQQRQRVGRLDWLTCGERCVHRHHVGRWSVGLRRQSDVAVVEADDAEATVEQFGDEARRPQGHLRSEAHHQQDRRGVVVAEALVTDLDVVGCDRGHRTIMPGAGGAASVREVLALVCDNGNMSDPDAPGAVPPPSNPLSSGSPTPPMGSPIPPGATEPPVSWAATEPTAHMPTTEAGMGSGLPPGTPPGTPYEDPYEDPYGEPEPDEADPWYKRPGPLALLLVVLLALGGLIAAFLLSGGDDDVASPGASLLSIELTDQTGASIDAGFIAAVTGPLGSETAYSWIRPADAVPGELAGDSTGDDGTVAFEWAPDDTVDATTWAATVTVLQSLPAELTPPGPLVECVLQREGDPDTVVSMSVEVGEGDPAAERAVNYAFPNYQFLAGDTVECAVVVTRTVDDTTTTVAPTTVPPTTVADTTTPPTTSTTTLPATTTTVPVVTLPPQPDPTLWDVIDNSPDLSELKGLIQLADLVDVLDDPNATLTLLAPTNQAIVNAKAGVGAPDFNDPDVVEAILLTHVNDTVALSSAQLLALDPPSFVVVNPGPHAIDAGASPPTVGGAQVLLVDVTASNGVLHVIDKVLLPVALP